MSIVMYLQGGLGNQMFQYAFGYNLAKLQGTNLELNTMLLGLANVPRAYRLNEFGIEKTNNQYCEVPIVEDKLEYNYIYKDYAKASKDKDYCFRGYFQSEEYFKESESDIREKFNLFDVDFGEQASAYCDKITFSGTNNVAVHVRRTDYVNNSELELLDREYYVKAMEYFYGKRFFFFSDDIEYCKREYPGHTYIDGVSDIESIALMSLCDNNIIANSSFSWWAAYLNRNYGKTIIAPKKWFKTQSSKTLIPDSWIRI